jgi:hypothetical protein
MGSTDDAVLSHTNKVTHQKEELKCSCGGAYKLQGPLFVYNIPPAVFNSAKVLKIQCRACSAPFRKRGPSRYACTSCTSFGLVQEGQIWFLNDRVSISFE